jgi:NADPH:quinone reductase-like Zn-dependent oxidoreductase
MPKIVRLHRVGGPENLKLEDEASSRQPGKGEAKLRVQAVGLNRAEATYMRGFYLEQPNYPRESATKRQGSSRPLDPTSTQTGWVSAQPLCLAIR